MSSASAAGSSRGQDRCESGTPGICQRNRKALTSRSGPSSCSAPGRRCPRLQEGKGVSGRRGRRKAMPDGPADALSNWQITIEVHILSVRKLLPPLVASTHLNRLLVHLARLRQEGRACRRPRASSRSSAAASKPASTYDSGSRYSQRARTDRALPEVRELVANEAQDE
jgi:hypothetical protein